ncbi:hypothetical protein AVEN_263521-1 [Araneus ventricosus]|uniref:Mos1 transposase HTH domain-containing protein n=1 Tax=Araneus ventricosus TaxID=182803 RepID=A0A4Y2SWK9_ARAVE|nr:hypothetical protein AVEN_263521-1 [Araneus ventricosus]
MLKTIQGPAACEIHSIDRILIVRNMPPFEIHRQICEMYDVTVMSERTVMVSFYCTTMPCHIHVTQQLIKFCGREQVNRPPYSPDRSPSVFLIFLQLKRSLSDKRFDDVGKVKDAVIS